MTERVAPLTAGLGEPAEATAAVKAPSRRPGVQTAGPTPWRAFPRRWWALLPAYVLVAAAIFRDAWLDPRGRLVGSPGDAQQCVWWLAWVPHAIGHGLNPLLTDAMNAPVGINVMWNTAVLPVGAVMWPVTAWLGPVFSYNIVATLAPGLSAWFAFLALRRWVRSPLPAAAGGLLYGFSPYEMAHAGGHLDLSIVLSAPLLLMLLDDLLIRQQRSTLRLGLWLGLLGALQLLTGEELLASEALAAAALVAVLALLFRERLSRARIAYALRGLAWSMVSFLPLVAYPLWVQFRGPQALVGTVHPVGSYPADLANLFIPASHSVALYPSVLDRLASHLSGHGAEQASYAGIALLGLLIAVAWLRWGRPEVRVATLTGSAMLILAMGGAPILFDHSLHVPLPGLLLEHVPVLRNLLPVRLTLYCFLAAALLVAVAIEEIREGALSRVQRLAGCALLAATLVTLLPRFDYPVTNVAVPAFFSTAADLQRIPEGATVLVAPYVASPVPDDPMVWQAVSGMRFKMPEGYFVGPGDATPRILGPQPTAIGDALQAVARGQPLPPPDLSTRAAMLAELHDAHVSLVIVGPMTGQPAALAFLRSLLGTEPESLDGIYLWDQVPG